MYKYSLNSIKFGPGMTVDLGTTDEMVSPKLPEAVSRPLTSIAALEGWQSKLLARAQSQN
jgi:hypothetical protein